MCVCICWMHSCSSLSSQVLDSPSGPAASNHGRLAGGLDAEFRELIFSGFRPSISYQPQAIKTADANTHSRSLCTHYRMTIEERHRNTSVTYSHTHTFQYTQCNVKMPSLLRVHNTSSSLLTLRCHPYYVFITSAVHIVHYPDEQGAYCSAMLALG